MCATARRSCLPSALFTLLLLGLCTPFIASARRTDSGLEIFEADGISCERRSQAHDTVTVHYKGSLDDGTVFDSSYKSGTPMVFQLGMKKVIQGFDEGIAGMCAGQDRKLVIPPSLAYGFQRVGPIPPGSTLTFEVKLLQIQPPNGAPITATAIETATAATTATSSTVTTSTTKAAKVSTALNDVQELASSAIMQQYDSYVPLTTSTSRKPAPTATTGSSTATVTPHAGADAEGECRLLGPFALVVQAGLGLLALLALVYKRWRERPRRPLKVWFFDASKQVVGSVLLHALNLLMSLFAMGDIDLSHKAQVATSMIQDQGGRGPNPCSLYLINLAIDTTLGIPILVVLLRIIHAAALITPLARPRESIKSGHYGRPARATWWLKQSLLYFIGLVLMKLCVLFLFAVLPWIVWVGDWALRWTEGNETVQIAFVMFIFPLVMNGVQYYVIDAFIKEPGKDVDGQGAGGEEQDSDAREPLTRAQVDEDAFDDEQLEGKKEGAVHATEREVVLGQSDESSGSGSSGSSPADAEVRNRSTAG